MFPISQSEELIGKDQIYDKIYEDVSSGCTHITLLNPHIGGEEGDPQLVATVLSVKVDK